MMTQKVDPYASKLHRRIDVLLLVLIFSLFALLIGTSAHGQSTKIRSEWDSDDWWAVRETAFFPRYQFTLTPTTPVFAKLSRPNLEYFPPIVGPDAVTGTAKDFNASTDLTNGANYSPTGTPTNTTDVRLTSSSTALRISTASVTMESLSIANGTSYSIANATTTSTNRTLTLGNSAGFTNVFSGVANDLIFLSGNSNLTIQGPNASTGTGTLSLALANSGNFNVATGSTLTINANISGSVSITKTGGGTAVINPTKTLYTGNTIINGGTLAASTGDYFGPFNSSITINAGTLRYDVTYTGGGNTIVVGSASSAIDTNGSGVSYTPGVISGSGSLTKNGLGTLNLSSVNTFTGGFTANAGLTNLNVNGALGSVTSVTIGTGATVQSPGTGTTNVINDAASVSLSGTGALDVSGGTETVGSLASTSGTPFVVIGDFSGTAGSFTVGDSSSTTFAGVISGSRATAGAIFTKQGSGTLTLSGANTYTGQTVINNGTLSLDNAGSTTPRLVNTTNITVNSGGTLLLASSSGSSTDRINNAATITLAGGTFNLGGRSEGAAGTSGVGALTLTNNSVFDFGTLGTSNLIQFAGLGTHTSSALFQIIDWEGTPGSANGTDRLLFAGTSSAFTSLYNQSDVSFNGEFGYDVMDFGTFYEVFGVAKVPEPSTWASAALALLAVGYSQRRRFSKQSALVKIG